MPNAKRQVVNRHKVRFIMPQEIECVIRAELGFTTKAIAEATGLSESMVQYRVTKAGVRRADYRSGESVAAKQALSRMHDMLAKHVAQDIAPRFNS